MSNTIIVSLKAHVCRNNPQKMSPSYMFYPKWLLQDLNLLLFVKKGPFLASFLSLVAKILHKNGQTIHCCRAWTLPDPILKKKIQLVTIV